MGELIYLPVIFNFVALENWGWEEFLCSCIPFISISIYFAFIWSIWFV